VARTAGTDADLSCTADRSCGRYSVVVQRSAVSAQTGLPLKQAQSTLAHDLDAKASAALDAARGMPPGDERSEAMHEAMALRNAVEIHELLCGKPDAPAG
jgi:hypothetical protein